MSEQGAIPTLHELLEAEPDAAVHAERIEAILQSISLSDSEVAISAEGTFRMGPLVGAHRPEQARYIGATARARHRAARLAEVERQRTSAVEGRDTATAESSRLNVRLEQLDHAIEELPKPDEARETWKALHRAEASRYTQAENHSQAASRHTSAQRASAEAHRALQLMARDHGTPATRSELDALHLSLKNSRAALDAYARSCQSLASSQEALASAQEEAKVLEDEELEARAEHRHAQDHHREKAGRFKALTASLGSEVKQILAEIQAATTAQKSAEVDRKRADNRKHQADKTKANFIGEHRGLEKQLPDLVQDVDRDRERLAPFHGAAPRSLLGVEDGDTPFEDRLFEAVASASFSTEQLKSTETRVDKRLATLDEDLGSRFHGVRSNHDGIVMVAIADELGEHGLARFQSRLSERVQTAKHLLDDHEQKLFEDHLLGTLCGQLRERIQETRVLVTSMDDAMRVRRLASGKSVGISWKVHGDADTTRKELLELLGFDARFLTHDRLAKVRTLLSGEVQSVRRERPDRTYQEILEGALDYRRWHHFELTLYDASGKATKLSRRAHSRLSGGEKAAAVHLPLFAAAHAHFNAGDPHCPRLVALDEAFAGIDDIGVPELLRLAQEFDLDWFLTGHDLWVTESFLLGVMHYDLAHDAVSRTVSAWPILWNGSETLEGDAVSP